MGAGASGGASAGQKTAPGMGNADAAALVASARGDRAGAGAPAMAMAVAPEAIEHAVKAAVSEAVTEAIAGFKQAMHAEVRNLHVELLRQFHQQQEENHAAFRQLAERHEALVAEVAALRRHQQEFLLRK